MLMKPSYFHSCGGIRSVDTVEEVRSIVSRITIALVRNPRFLAFKHSNRCFRRTRWLARLIDQGPESRDSREFDVPTMRDIGQASKSTVAPLTIFHTVIINGSEAIIEVA